MSAKRNLLLQLVGEKLYSMLLSSKEEFQQLFSKYREDLQVKMICYYDPKVDCWRPVFCLSCPVYTRVFKIDSPPAPVPGKPAGRSAES